MPKAKYFFKLKNASRSVCKIPFTLGIFNKHLIFDVFNPLFRGNWKIDPAVPNKKV
jgi:hypothetical protein